MEDIVSRRLIRLALIAAVLASCALPNGLSGSGTPATRTFALEGFTSIKACCGMQVILSGGDDFAVAVTSDKNVLPAIQTTVVGDTPHLGGDTAQGRSFATTTLEVRVTMPVFEALTLSGGAQLGLGDTAPQAVDVRLEASGGSQANLLGMPAQHTQVTLSGGAHLDHTGAPSIGRAVNSGGASVSRHSPACRPGERGVLHAN